ncbi:3,4-dihydroxy-2-butanone-4-phosphate synthase [Mycolicibacterium litorale]|uniref:3,4-dihydroxy-2-butanone-4-phosphate synthase n=1 Tax=Mycolicibacterium litorale TaxID=758802 RepID=UPI003CFB5BC1
MRDTAVVTEIACGRAALIPDGERGAVLFFAAEAASTSLLAFAIRHSSGLIHAAMRPDRLDLLRIHDQPVLASEDGALGFTVSVDAVGTGTGISGQDRARTLRVLGSRQTVPGDLVRPGHVLPVRCPHVPRTAREVVWDRLLGIVERAGCTPVAAACRLVHDSGDVLDDSAAIRFAAIHGIAVVSVRPRVRMLAAGA